MIDSTYITQLPEYTSRARELQWCMEHYQKELIHRRSQRDYAWRMYDAVLENPTVSKEEKEEFALAAEIMDALADEAWRDFENAKADYLQLFN